MFLHGLAGDLACLDQDEHTVLATDTVAHLARAFRCRVRVLAAPDVVRERLWTDQARLDDLGDGTCRLHLAADHAEGAVLMLVGMGLEIVVESPDELDEALDELPEEQRSIFIKHELEGYSFKELAAESGVSVNTLLSRKRYAVLYLRQRLQLIYDEFVRN